MNFGRCRIWRRCRQSSSPFYEREQQQADYIEYLHSIRLYNLPPKGKSDNITALSLIPIDSRNPVEADTWYYDFISFRASGGDVPVYERLYKYTDWAETYKIYTLRLVDSYG